MLFAALIQNVENSETGLLGKHIYPLHLYTVLNNVKLLLSSCEDVLFEILKRLKYVSSSKLFLLATSLIIIFFFIKYFTGSQFYLFQRMGGCLLKCGIST